MEDISRLYPLIQVAQYVDTYSGKNNFLFATRSKYYCEDVLCFVFLYVPGPATGTCATTCTPGPNHIKNMIQSTDAFPLNFGFTGMFHLLHWLLSITPVTLTRPTPDWQLMEQQVHNVSLKLWMTLNKLIWSLFCIGLAVWLTGIWSLSSRPFYKFI